VRKPPFNYLVAIATIAILWIVASLFIGNYLADNAALVNATTEDFSRVYRIVMSIAAVAAASGLAHWYWVGASDSAATDLAGARRFWTGWFLILLTTSVGCVAGLILTFRDERLALFDYMVAFGSASLLTWVPYWLCSLLMSPRGVKHAPLGMR
jgi:hypothetical protein